MLLTVKIRIKKKIKCALDFAETAEPGAKTKQSTHLDLFIHSTHLTQSQPLVSILIRIFFFLNSVYLVNVFRKCILSNFRLDRSWTDDLDTNVVL